jgi:DNA processing protein
VRTVSARGGACRDCRRHAWLLGRLSVLLNFHAHDESKLLELLALEDAKLIDALGGRRRGELRAEWERFEADDASASGPEAAARPAAIGAGEPSFDHPSAPTAGAEVETVCVHDPARPAWRGRSDMPRMLHVLGGADRLVALTARPTIAIVGSVRPTDYGIEMARSLARGLTVSGVTIVSGLANGIAAAAHAGALEAQGASVTVMAGGVDVVAPAARQAVYERVIEHGCAVAELPCGHPVPRWCEPARARTIAALADVTIVVEAGERRSELGVARAAEALGRTVAAIPGRVTSPASIGTNRLLLGGARLVRGPADALDLLYGLGGPTCVPSPARGHDAPGPAQLRPQLQSVLEQVGAGLDTPGKLTTGGGDLAETLLALSELELMGLIGRGDGGRYVPLQALGGPTLAGYSFADPRM